VFFVVESSTIEDQETREPRLLTLPRIGVVESVLLLCVPLGAAAALAGMVFTDAFSGNLLIDPGVVVTRGLPIARVVHDAAACVSVGLLLIAAFALPGQSRVPGVASYSQWTAARWAARSAAVWAAAAIAVLVFTAANTVAIPVGEPRFWPQFWFFTTGIELGQSLLVSIVLILVVLVALLLSKRLTAIGFAAVASVLALLPLALSGHAAGSDEHANAVDSLAMHLVGVTAWTGGLIAIVLLRRRLGDDTARVVSRYSLLALWAFVLVAFSGTVNASLRLKSVADLVATPYGLLISVKIVILVGLGVAGAWQRRRIIPGLVREPGRTRAFVRLAVTEILFMALAIGVSVGLSRSAPPVSQESLAAIDIRKSLLGFDWPDPPTVWRVLTAFHPNWFWLAGAAVLAGLYLAAVLRLRKRGDGWPWGRTVPWIAGCAALVWSTGGGPGVYGAVSFSTHMIQHMALMMVVAPLLVLGAPVLLALRALPTRRDGGRGIREWILLLVHSPLLRLFANPVVAAVLFAGSLVAFYYSGWFEWSLQTHQGHFFMTVHFLATGYLFFFVLIGVDPGPERPSYPMRLILLLATLAFHAFFGLAVMSQATVLAEDWWHALGFTDTAALLADQRVGGGIAWGAGELPVVLVALAVVRQWVRSDERTAKRLDRKADRDGDADLAAYNARLAELAELTDRAGPAERPERTDRTDPAGR
jgi:putative copper resistance protein D